MSKDLRYCDCATHGSRRKAWFVCVHILRSLDRNRVHTINPWQDTPRGAGELICALGGPSHTEQEIVLLCEDDLIEMGLLRPSEARIT